jgi:hypothetical protein
MRAISRVLAGAAVVGVVFGCCLSEAQAAAPSRSVKSQRVAALLGAPASAMGPWVRVDALDGSRLQTLVRGVGLAQVSGRTGALDEVIFSDRLRSGTSNSLTAPALAASVAAAFAARHFGGFSALTLRHQAVLNHRSFVEYHFTWQQRRGLAWLPVKVTIGVNAGTHRGGAPVRVAGLNRQPRRSGERHPYFCLLAR